MTDEQRAREWLLPLLQDMVARVLSDHTVLKEQQQIIEQTAALLASRALEARNEALEEAAQLCEQSRHNEAHYACCSPAAIRSLAAASKAASKERP